MRKHAQKVPLADSAAAARLALRAAAHLPPVPGVPRPDGDLILGGGGFIDLKDRKTQHYGFASVDLAARRVGLVATNFLPHGVAIDPLQPTRIVSFEKIGPGCAEVKRLMLKGRSVFARTQAHCFFISSGCV